MSISRRALIAGASSLLLAGCAAPVRRPAPALATNNAIDPRYISMYAARPEERFPLPAVNLKKVDPAYYRRLVDFPTVHKVGTIIVDTPNRYLYLVMEGGKAMRYGVGIGRDGFAWGGEAYIGRKNDWPTWTPPAEMIARQPELEEYRNGMDPGLSNPLGARALYIYQDGRDTLYRLHGTAEEWSIGRAVSSGCVRLLNQDIVDLYSRVPVGANVIVLQDRGLPVMS